MELGLSGKVALVTGASEGIGMAIAWRLAEEGVRVAICARTEATLRETAARIAKATGMEVAAIPADLRSLAGCQGFVDQAAARLGGVDILVNNAGASAFGAFVELPDDAFVDAINGKLLGYIRVNSVAPGRIRTARADRLLEATAAAQGKSPDEVMGELVRTIPSGRLGTIDDVAEAVCFLASERAAYVNGAALVVDGSKSVVI